MNDEHLLTLTRPLATLKIRRIFRSSRFWDTYQYQLCFRMPSLLSTIAVFCLIFAVFSSPSPQNFEFKSEMSSNTKFEHNFQHSFKQEFNHQPQPMPMAQMQVQPAPAVSHRQYQTSYQMQRQSQPMVQSYSTSHSSFHVSFKQLHKSGACICRDDEMS
ncbi:hypothetical protein WR25_01967 [Diploscapter pachys]|uniref:Uncharacterized protein n=1 Tax=Diploscapter pachys TaxID=2018661 RepID=A0A2A2L113_9BILA|nr:hypothetical protein WR25_01967 [Diploscapter pachys]